MSELVPFQLVWANEADQVHYTYVLFSRSDGKLYIGATGNLRQRLKDHAEGRVRSTTHRRTRLAASLAGIRENKLERH